MNANLRAMAVQFPEDLSVYANHTGSAYQFMVRERTDFHLIPILFLHVLDSFATVCDRLIGKYV